MKTNINGYCPACGVCLDGDLVLETFLKQGKPFSTALEWAKHYCGYSTHGLNNRWGRKICVYDLELDRTTHYQCPDCKESFKCVVD